jgi:hypothetical protein
MRVTRVTSPVSVYPATRPVSGILRRVIGATRRSWVWRINFSVPPRPYLLGPRQAVERVIFPLPGGVGIVGEAELAVVPLDKELEAPDQVGLLGRDGALGNAGAPLYLPLRSTIVIVIEVVRAPIILLELVDSVQYPAVGITQVDHRA